jgi:hypothetical protein
MLSSHPTEGRLAHIANAGHTFSNAALTTSLVGSAPGAAAGLMSAQDTFRTANLESRKLRQDDSLRARPVKTTPVFKLDDAWKNHVSERANAGHDYLRRGQANEHRKGVVLSRHAATEGMTAAGLLAIGTVMRKPLQALDPKYRTRTQAVKGIVGSLGVDNAIGAVTAHNQARHALKTSNSYGSKADRIVAVGRKRQRESVNVGKAVIPVPSGTLTGAVTRNGGLVRSSTGRVSTRRGSLVRTTRSG